MSVIKNISFITGHGSVVQTLFSGACMSIASRLKIGINDFRPQFAMLLALLGVFLLAPFIIVNLVNSNYLLASGIFVVVVTFIYLNFIIRRNHKRVKLVGWFIAPIMLPILLFAFSQLGIKGALWLYPAVIVLYLVIPIIPALIINVVLVIAVTFMAINVLDTDIAIRLVASLTAVNVFIAGFIFVLEAQQRYLKHLALTDQLTGLRNRTHLHAKVEELLALANRAKTPISLISLDLDLFKRINDTYGHAVGDESLKALAKLLLERIRKTDMAYRMGGEEFLLILHDTDLKGALNLAEELRSKIENSDEIRTTSSFGVAAYQHGETFSQCLKRSDDCLYQAKNSGRNCVVSHEVGVER